MSTPHFCEEGCDVEFLTGRMSLNPEPLGIVADDDERAISSLVAWRRSATRADRLRVWLALGGTREDFDAEHPAP